MKIREKTEKKVFSYIEQHKMIEAGDTVVIGVSGGADSVCLLLLLLEYRKKKPFIPAVVHIHHGIREDAGEDAAYVEQLCRERGVSCRIVREDVPGLAAEQGCSLEDAGRRARYKAFQETAAQLGGGTIAVAHNKNDNAETMLFHLFRGSGLTGLCGISPRRSTAQSSAMCCSIIRPLLCLEREEIEAYLTERQISWRTDSTNEEDEYSRNRIRHHILPYVERELVSGAVEHMSRTAELLRETEDYLEQQTREARAGCVRVCERGRKYEIEAERFGALHEVLRKRLLYQLAKELSPTGKDISAVHVEDVLSLFHRQGNRTIRLPFGITAERQYGKVLLFRKDSGTGEAEVPEDCVREEDLGREFEFELFFPAKGQEVLKNQYTKWFDYDKIEESPIVRFRRQGDYLTLSDGKGNLIHKTLKDYMITEKIPREDRDRIPVLAVGSHVIWLVGYRISEYFKVNANTKRVLQVKLKRDCPQGETEEEDVGAY